MSDNRVIVFALLLWIQQVTGDLGDFGYCLRDPSKPSIKECIGKTVISFLQQFDNSNNYTVSQGLVLSKDENLASRSEVNFLDVDPIDFRGLLENAGTVIGQRSLEWHLDKIHPGLMLRVGPTSDANSMLEFVMDSNQRFYDHNDGYLPDEPSTARVVATRYLLPFLLGIKFNLATIIPLIFGAVVLLLKKATFLAKLALYISTLFGVGGAFTLANLAGGSLGGGIGGIGGGGGHYHHQSFGGGLGGFSPIKSSSSYAATDAYDSGYGGLLRNERQFNFDKPRSTNEPISTHDKFYDYEKNVLGQERHITVHRKSHDDGFGWKVIK
ncbi:hypothetical protein ACFFRR_006868 [Megaselia abdita]